MQAQINNCTVHSVGAVQNIQGNNGRSFQKQELIVSWWTEGQYAKEQFRQIEASGKAIQGLNGVLPGSTVNVNVALNGGLYQDKNTGEPKVFNRDRLISIQVISGGGYQQAPQGQQFNNQNQGGFQNQQQNFQPPQGNQGSNQGFQGAGDPVDDIPF